MVKIEYEKPLEYYTVNNFIDESSKLIGKPVHSIVEPPSFKVASYQIISDYSGLYANFNPLYNNLNYGVTSKYRSIIALPTALSLFRYPRSEGVLYDGPYPLIGFEAGFDWEWNGVIRMNDSFTSELVLKDVYEKPSNKGRTIYLVSECKYWNQVNELVGKCTGTFAAVARAEKAIDIPDAIKGGFVNYPISDRKIHYYSDEEIERLIKEIKDMTFRGSTPLYWDNINVGDELPQVVKGPLTTGALMSFQGFMFSTAAFPTFRNAYMKWKNKPGFLRQNPTTSWPYEVIQTENNDPNMSPTAGMPYMFAMGFYKVGHCEHLLTNWMSDEGFIRKLKIDVREPYLYGDALWIKGKVIDKYKEKISDTIYRAVDLKIETINQEGQKVAPGTATVYLPTLTENVKLPIPQ